MNIRSYQNGDEIKIIELDRSLEVHPWNRRNLDNWLWKYTDKNPSGRSFIWLMEEGGRIIAHFAIVPYKLKVFDKELIASHSIAAMVEARYQNKGLLKFVGDKLFEELRENNIFFTYGFPNERAFRLHKGSMGYTDLIFFDTWKIGKSDMRNYKSKDSFHRVEKFNDDFDDLWKTCSRDYVIAVVRDKEYLNWRYKARPDWEYYSFAVYRDNVLKGYAVLKFYREDNFIRGHLLDIFARLDDRDTFNDIIEGSMSFFHDKGVDEVTCWTWGNSLWDKILKEEGFSQHDTKIPLVIRLNKEFEYSRDIMDNKNWYFTMGDSTEIF